MAAGAGLLTGPVAGAAPVGVATGPGDRSITYEGAVRGVHDLRWAGVGTEGFWFAAFDLPEPVTDAPTRLGAVDTLPAWVTPFNHSTGPTDPGCEPAEVVDGCLPGFGFRTFSQDGPARAAGGFGTWAVLGLPDGRCGRAGLIVDPHTWSPDGSGLPRFVDPPEGEPRARNNNTVNRIQLTDGTPAVFRVGVVVDVSGGAHRPGRLEIRGTAGTADAPAEVVDTQVEPTFAEPPDLSADGRPDVHVFRVEGFGPGDYLKLRLRGADGPAAFAGLVFDLGPAAPTPGRPPARRPGSPDGEPRARAERPGHPAGRVPVGHPRPGAACGPGPSR